MKKQAAFTLLETLIALSMMAILLTALASISYQSMFWIAYYRAEFQASQLSQEALEAVRWMVQENQSQNYTWHEGEVLWGQPILGLEEKAKRLALTRVPCPKCYEFTDQATINLGGETYERYVSLEWKQENLLHVKSEVNYEYRGKEYQFVLESFLTEGS